MFKKHFVSAVYYFRLFPPHQNGRAYFPDSRSGTDKNRAVRRIFSCLRKSTASKGEPQDASDLYFTSVNTSSFPSLHTRSISPCLQRKFFPKMRNPCFCKKAARCFFVTAANFSFIHQIFYIFPYTSTKWPIKLPLWIGHGPSVFNASICAFVPYPLCFPKP